MPKKGTPQALPSNISSEKLIRAIKKLGAQKAGRPAKGSHEMWERIEDGKTYCAPIVLEASIPKPTLRSILRQLHINEKEFIQALGFTFIISHLINKVAAPFLSLVIKLSLFMSEGYLLSLVRIRPSAPQKRQTSQAIAVFFNSLTNSNPFARIN